MFTRNLGEHSRKNSSEPKTRIVLDSLHGFLFEVIGFGDKRMCEFIITTTFPEGVVVCFFRQPTSRAQAIDGGVDGIDSTS